MLDENKIKQPKQITMENYKIIRDEDKYVLVDGFQIIRENDYMKFWGVSQKELGSSAHKFHDVLGSRGGFAKMFENICLENDGYSEQKTEMKNTKKNATFVS